MQLLAWVDAQESQLLKDEAETLATLNKIRGAIALCRQLRTVSDTLTTTEESENGIPANCIGDCDN